MNKKRLREVRNAIEQSIDGVARIEDVTVTGSGHVRFRLRRLSDNMQHVVVAAASPSCPRAMLNTVGYARRWASGRIPERKR